MALSDVIVAFNVHDWFGGDFDIAGSKAWATNSADDQKVDDTSTGESRIGSAFATVATDGTGTFTHWAPGADGNPISWQTSYHFDVRDRNAPDGRARKTFGPFTVTGTSKTVTNKALTTNVATLTTSTAHGLVVGNTITVAISDAVFDGTHTVTAVPSATTISYAKTNANVTSAAATGTLTSPNVLLTSLEEEQAVPATYLSTVTAALDVYTTAAAASAAAADVSEAAAAASAALADSYIVADLGTSDGQVEALIESPTSLTKAALSATYAPVASATLAAQPFLKRLKRNVEDATLMICGDSTADGTTDGPYQFLLQLAAEWPTHTFTYRTWGTTSYNAPTTIQTGTGTRTVNVYNASVAGWRTANILAPYYDAIVKVAEPDLIITTLGHNEATVAQDFRDRYANFTESVTATWPKARLICVAQNPAQTGNEQALRAQRIEEICALRGYGFVDVHQRFIDLGDFSAYMADTIHPNAAGALLWAGEVVKHFTYLPSAAPFSSGVSTLAEPTESLITNGDFAAFSGSVPANWTATDCTVTKDLVDYENPAGYSVVLTDAGAVSVSYISQALPAKLVAGQWVTVTARVKIAAGQPYSAGNVGLADSSGETISLGMSSAGRDGWRWETVTRYFPVGVTSPVVKVYSDRTSVTSGVARVDRVIVSRGTMPRDLLLGGGTPGPQGDQGPAGSGTYVRKTANTARNNTAAQAADPHLTVSLAANASYDFECVLFANSASATPDLRLSFTWPGDATAIWGDIALTSAASSAGGSIHTAVAEVSGDMPGSSTVGLVAAKTMIVLRGHIRTVTAGDLALRWAQGTATVEDTTLYADSFLIATQRA